ncbi:unnamed protein product [Microthlaspi erraticum]|uniref:Thioglucosidase n=1 Tax=Microthlaspi erraticum TaxID=1685480 RepID=A0A6D2JDL4_9BRAS|nr:unnamed protein product [Microthlaspi erraticum]
MKFPLLGVLLLISLVGSPTRAEEGPVCPKTETLSRASFPEGFKFGTATASFQVEGAVNEGCRGPSMWDLYIKRFPARVQHHNADVAVDFYHRYKEDIQLIKKLNTDSFRISIAWPRIFPHGRMEKGISKEGVQFYHDVIDELIRNDITPLVTIFHWDIPADLEDEYGGFLSERIVPDFAEYANFTFQEYGDKVKNWVTFNEPWCKGGKIGIAHSPAWFEAEDVGGEETVNRVLDFIMGWHLDPTTTGDYPQSMKDAVGTRLPKFTKEQKEKLKGSADFVGINYYFSFFARKTEKPDPRSPTWALDAGAEFEPKTVDGSVKIGTKPSTAKMGVYAAGLRKLLKYIKDRYGNPEIIITENGYGEDLGDKDNDHDVALNDHNRKYYLQRHLLTLHQAICEDKVNVTGYFLWSLMDNFEWQEGYTARFGVYYIDFKNNLTRIEKESARWYREFLKPGMPTSKIKLNEEL